MLVRITQSFAHVQFCSFVGFISTVTDAPGVNTGKINDRENNKVPFLMIFKPGQVYSIEK